MVALRQIVINRLSTTAKIPNKAHETDAGFDIYSDEDVYIFPNKATAVGTGVIIQIPTGYYGRLKARSGLTIKTHLRVVEGTIDSGYRGELKVMCDAKDAVHEIHKGDKIAQLIIQPLPEFEVVEGEIDMDSKRGQGGFGSTGRR